MKSKTLKELREIAKTRRLKGYSKLTKEELVRQLDQRKPAAGAVAEHATPAPRAQKAPPKKVSRKTKTAKSEAMATAATPPATASGADALRVAPPSASPAGAGFASAEELVEGTKYALRPNGRHAAQPAADLDEDIDRLPVLTEPVVRLLAQKPGILYAYWALPPGEAAERGDYKLRLCRATDQALEVREEIAVATDRGHWYFHVSAESGELGMLVQLGYYHNGEFLSARGRSIARLPSLYASTRTDERWWVNEEQFLAMYLRAGGFVTPSQRYGWAASIGSPGAVSQPPEKRMAWPGGVGSPSK